MTDIEAKAHRRGVLLVLLAATFWSSGGLIARQIEAGPWTIIAWRGLAAFLTLLVFLLLRDGRGTWRLFRDLGLPGLTVAACFAAASTGFVIALQHASVALILTVQATSPLIAGIVAWFWMREPIGWPRALAMGAALCGILLMVGEARGNDLLGILLSGMIASVFALATVTTRRYRHIRMTPACCLAAAVMSLIGFALADTWAAGAADLVYMFLFGAVQLGCGLICFTIGARHVPAAQTTLLALLETVLGSLWVFLFAGENPGWAALYGGALVIAAVAASSFYDQRRMSRIPVGGA